MYATEETNAVGTGTELDRALNERRRLQEEGAELARKSDEIEAVISKLFGALSDQVGREIPKNY